MKIVRKENGNILLTDNSGNTIKRFPEYAVLELKSDREGEFVRIAYGHQNKHDIYPNQITATQIEPNAEVSFNGTAQDLINITSTSFFFNITQGFVDYNDTSSVGGVLLPANTWVDIPNNGLGQFTNKLFLPQGVSELIDTSTGYLDCSQLKNGDDIIIRNDFIVTPNGNRANLFFRYSLGSGAGVYTLEKRLDRLDSGAGNPYQFNLNTDYIYMGEDNTRLSPIKMQLLLSKNGTFVNNGSAIKVRIR